MSEKILTRLSEIRDEAVELRDELTALSELDELDDDQEARFNELTGDESPIEELRAERETLERRLDVIKAASRMASTEDGEDRSVQFMKQTDTRVDAIRASRSEVRDAALKVLENEHHDQLVPLSDESAARVERLMKTRSENLDGDIVARRLLVTESDAYRSAWAKSVTQASPAYDQDEVHALNEFRAVEQSLTAASGGLGVPVLIDPTIILTSGADVAPLLSVARIESITNNIWKGVSSAGVAFTGTAEAVAATATQATIAQPSVTPEKAMAYIPYSFEIQGDYPGFATEMASLIESAYVDYLATETATGSAGLVGIFTAIDATAGSEVNPTTDGALGPADALVVWKALPERFRARSTWFMNVTVESQLRNSTYDGGLYTTNLSTDGIGPLLGKRVLLSDHAPSFTGTTGASNLAILGDFQHFVIAQRVGMNVELIPNVVDGSGVPTGQRAWLAWARVGSDSVADQAFRLLQNA
jgi:HK97 family phage major capsid protein